MPYFPYSPAILGRWVDTLWTLFPKLYRDKCEVVFINLSEELMGSKTYYRSNNVSNIPISIVSVRQNITCCFLIRPLLEYKVIN